MKRILIVTHFFYPRNVPRAFRAKELVSEFRNQGYSVDVIIGDYKQLVQHEEYNEKLFENRIVNNSKVAKLSNNHIISILKNVVTYFIGERYLLTSSSYLYKNIDVYKYDAILSIGLPFYVNFVTALKINRYRKPDAIYIADWSDPFYKAKEDRIAPYFRKLQKIACSAFDYITIPTKTAISYFSEYISEEKIRVIPQGFDFSKTKLVDYKENEVIQFGYAGIFYKNIRNPEKFLEFLTSIDREFVFVLYTITHGPIYTDILQRYKQILGDKLQIHDLIPRDECITKLSQMDFLINIENSTSNQIPSKLIDYALTGRPILSFRQDEIPEDKIISFINRDYSGAMEIDLEAFNIKNVCQQFINLFNKKEGELN